MTVPTDDRPVILRRYRQAMLDLSADDLARLYASDAVHELPFLFPGLARRLTGRDEIRRVYASAWAASPARPERIEQVALHLGADPGLLVTEQIVHGTLCDAQRPFCFPGILVLRVRRGRIVAARDYMDGLAVARATGRLEAVAAALAGSG